MAEATACPVHSVEVLTQTTQGGQTVVMRLQKAKSDKKVQWDEAVVDNEHMNKKKSKCCCIYEKPRGPDDESDSEPEGDCCHEHRVARARVPRH